MSLDQLKARRDAVIDTLSDAFSNDTLAVEEFEKRLALAHRAEDTEGLEQTVRDLPKRSMGPETSTALAAVQTQALAVVPDTRKVLAVLGSTTRRGVWSVPKKLKVNAICGAVELDLRDAVLGPGVTEIQLSAVFGAIDIIVPPHLAVEVDGVAILGAFDHIERAPANPAPDTPILRIKGTACFGAVDVVTKVKRR